MQNATQAFTYENPQHQVKNLTDLAQFQADLAGIQTQDGQYIVIKATPAIQDVVFIQALHTDDGYEVEICLQPDIDRVLYTGKFEHFQQVEKLLLDFISHHHIPDFTQELWEPMMDVSKDKWWQRLALLEATL